MIRTVPASASLSCYREAVTVALLALSFALGGCGKTAPTASITIDARQIKPISPYIYGVNQPDWDNFGFTPTFVRQGGNRMTAYNWTNNASNAGNDYHFQNDGFMGASNEPGWTVSTFLKPAQEHGAAVLLTVPMAGYVSADKKADGDVMQTPDYIHVRFKPSMPKKPGPFSDPVDPSAPVVYQDEFAHWVEKTKNPSLPVWFSLDNEPDIWSGTHKEIVPKTPTYEDFLARSIAYAQALKAVAPETKIFGWSSYGWMGFRRFQNAPDANNRDFTDFYLARMKQAETQTGKRLLDVLDLHWYPEAKGGGQRITEGDKPEAAAARIQAPRSLWDPGYVEDSWIAQSIGGKAIRLIPDVLERIEKFYPGTQFALTEYSYGGGKDVSGMIAEADVLGIFGQYGLFAASNWGVSPADTATVAGFLAFENYDGAGGKFGAYGLAVQGTTAPLNSVYAALSAKGGHTVTVVLINKTDEPQPFKLSFRGITPTKGTGYLRDKGSMRKPQDLKVSINDGDATTVLPPLSVATISVSE